MMKLDIICRYFYTAVGKLGPGTPKTKTEPGKWRGYSTLGILEDFVHEGNTAS